MLVRRLPKDQVLRGLLDAAQDERKLWSRRAEYWLDKAIKRKVALPAYYSAASATSPLRPDPE
jgi:hypothetical protein